ncbi:MAG: polymer-forming cytoskeletal protein [Thermoanaerobacterales bacterium]|nr:polymer-forming cytoskeletal protein [Thermoanaerobacterales bacterium]
MAVMVLVVLMLLASAAVTLAAQYRTLAAHQYRQTRAYYIAEAGVEKALADPAFLYGLAVDSGGTLDDDYADATVYLNDAEFAGGTLTVAVTRKADDRGMGVFRIYATGRVGNDARVLKAEVRMPLFAFYHGLLSGKQIKITLSEVAGNVNAEQDIDVLASRVTGDVSAGRQADVNSLALISGDVGAGQDVKIHDLCVVAGSVWAEQDVEVRDLSLITGDARANKEVKVLDGGWIDGIVYAPKLVTRWPEGMLDWQEVDPGVSVRIPRVPDLNVEYLKQIADFIYAPSGKNSHFKKTFTTAELTGITGVYFVDGDVEILGRYSGQATIVCTGEAVIRDLTRDGEDDVLAVIAARNVTLDGSAQALIFAGGTVSLSFMDSLGGAIIAGGDVKVENGSRFLYEQEMAENPPPGLAGKPVITTWQEKYPPFPEKEK